jgi:hypothetical protein
VLTAVGQVSWPPGITQVSIEILDPLGDDAGVTPGYATASNPQTVPVLALQAQTQYTLTAVGTYADGGGILSAPVAFTTESLPPGFRTFETKSGEASGPYTLVSFIEGNAALGVEYAPVLGPTGIPVWYLTLPQGHGISADFQKQSNHTYTVATYDAAALQPDLNENPSIYVQYDVLGNQLATWKSPDEPATDEHDIRILTDGTALLNGIEFEHLDLSKIVDGGLPDAGIYGDMFERIAPDGGVLFHFSSFTLPITDEDPSNPLAGQTAIDGYHSNAIEVMDDGNYLLSYRNLSEAVKVDSTTGDILWILGGPRSSFTFVNDPLLGFRLQHGVRELANGHIIMFDDGYERNSRAVEYELDMTAMTATLIWSVTAENPAYQTYAFGYADRLENGNTLICYGTASTVEEVTPDGGLVWDLYDQNHDYGFYRSYRLDSLY